MKAEIDENGVLTVSAEVPLESYALRKWMDGYCYFNGAESSCEGESVLSLNIIKRKDAEHD